MEWQYCSMFTCRAFLVFCCPSSEYDSLFTIQCSFRSDYCLFPFQRCTLYWQYVGVVSMVKMDDKMSPGFMLISIQCRSREVLILSGTRSRQSVSGCFVYRWRYHPIVLLWKRGTKKFRLEMSKKYRARSVDQFTWPRYLSNQYHKDSATAAFSRSYFQWNDSFIIISRYRDFDRSYK